MTEGIDWDKLPEVLGQHGEVYWSRDDSGTFCQCDAKLSDDMVAEPGHALDAHLAAVVREWVEGQMTEEWGSRDPDEVHTVMFHADREGAERRASYIFGGQPCTLVRRLVTDWEAVS